MNIAINKIINKWNLNKYQPIDLNQLKLNVIHGNENEINKANDELEKLKENLESFPKLYCKKNRHSYVITSCYKKRDTGRHSFAGYESIYEITYKCTVCGHCHYSEGSTFSTPSRGYYERKIPIDLYDDKDLQIDGRTYRMTQEEISRLEDYIVYRQKLKKKICELAGHTMTRKSYYKCICCGKTMSFDEYRDYLKDNPITLTRDTFASLPTFEEYQNEEKQKETQANNESSSTAKTKKIKYN